MPADFDAAHDISVDYVDTGVGEFMFDVYSKRRP